MLTYDEFSKETGAGGYFDATKKALIKQINFMFPDADKGAIYIVTTAQDVIPEVKTLLVDSIFAVFVILFLTAVMMVVWIYSSMINPIKKLQIAAENILKTKKKLNEILAANTGKPYDVVAADTERDYYMSAQEAAEYGLIDSVMTSR